MASLYEKHLQQADAWMRGEPNLDFIYIEYNQLMADPAPHVRRVNDFLGGALDVDAMTQVADRSLYRQQR
jgi:LPS sulfotransferase NodH